MSFFKQYSRATIVGFFCSLFLLFAVFAVYENSFKNKFVWDDEGGITANTYVHNFEFLNFFSGAIYDGVGDVSNFWRPLVLTVFAVEWKMFGLFPGGYHVVNTLLHGFDAILVFYLLRLLFGRTTIAFLAALVFAVHPLNTEAITYISGIADPLAGFFMLLGTIWYIKSEENEDKKRTYIFGTVACFLLALLSKESAIVMPGFLLLADIFSKREKLHSWKDLAPSFKKLIPFVAIFAVYVLLRLTVLDFLKEVMPITGTLSFSERILTFARVFATYIGLMFAPLHLHMEWNVPIVNTLRDSQTIGGLLILCVFFAGIVTQFKKRPEISFGLAWFLVALSPNTNIFFGMLAFGAEHWLYLSLPFFFFALFSVAEECAQMRFWRIFILVIFTGWTFWIGSVTITRNRDWADAPTIFTSTLKESPVSYRAYMNLGAYYMTLEKHPTSLLYFEKALPFASNPSAPLARIGKEYELMKNDDEALVYYKKSVDADPVFSPVFNSLIDYYTTKKEYANAISLLEKRATKTNDPVEKGKLFFRLASIAEIKNDTVMRNKYLAESDLANQQSKSDMATKLGQWLNRYLGEPQ